MDKKKLLEEHFKHFAEINGRKSELKRWFDLKLFRLTGESEKTPYGYYKVYYTVNKLNPIIYLVIVAGFFSSIFTCGLNEFFTELKSEWNHKEKLEVKTSILEQNAEV